MPLAPGQVLQNRYRIVKLLGQGGFGAVYRAWDMNMKAACAVKENLDTSPAAQSQFEREAMLLFGLRHPNLPVVHDHFLIPGQGQYLVMDFIEGEDLESIVQQKGALPVDQALEWIGEVCEALTYLHTRQPPVIHRDIKPANIRVTPSGKAMLVDFGIAKTYDPALGTKTGARAYTPGYSSPEQHSGVMTDAQSDIYSLGATAYTLLTGKIPPDTNDITAGLQPAPAPPHQVNPLVPVGVSLAVAHAMQLNRSLRPRTVVESKAEMLSGAVAYSTNVLAPVAQSTPTLTVAKKPRRGLLLGGVIAAILVVIGGIWVWNTLGGPALTNEQRGGTADMRTMRRTQTALAQFLEDLTGLPEPLATLSPAMRVTDTPTATLLPPTLTFTIIPNTPTPTLSIGSTMIWEKDGMQMVYVPAGLFLMGTNPGNQGALRNETPQHTVTLDGFWIDKTEVTNGQYAQCVADGACPPPFETRSDKRSSYYDDPQYTDFPVINVSWNYASNYCLWAGRRLPTEAEWEKAARGTDGRIYPWGNQSPTCDLANYSYCVGDTAKVGSYPSGASIYGTLDMAGNVWEWVQDWYDENYYQIGPAENPPGPASGKYRVFRGASWEGIGWYVRVSIRIGHFPDSHFDTLGFRCASSP